MSLLRCPRCRGRLRETPESLSCDHGGCGGTYPVVRGAPVLLVEERSVFSVDDAVRAFNHSTDGRSWRGALAAALPTLGDNTRASAHLRELLGHLRTLSSSPSILVVGGHARGAGYEVIEEAADVVAVSTDVRSGPYTDVISDAHDLPFADASFDGVVAQAVLEHVVDPARCTDEIHRVLRPGGLVYAEVPFMQQVHAGAHDFSRFTLVGLRRLFRRFDEVSSGALCGPGMALAWSYERLLLSAAIGRITRDAARVAARLTAFWLKHLDARLMDRPDALDAASAFYFLGRRAEKPIDDRAILRGYRGADHA